MDKDKLLDKVLNGEGAILKCPKCFSSRKFVKGFLICLNEECDYQLRILEGGSKQ